jgi:hypothetical protein
VLFAVDLDVALQVPTKDCELSSEQFVLIADESAKHVGDEVLAAKGEGCGDDMEFGGVDEAEGGGDAAAEGTCEVLSAVRQSALRRSAASNESMGAVSAPHCCMARW